MDVKKNILDTLWADPRTLFMEGMFIKSEPFLDQVPAGITGGIRKPIADFTQPHYIEMWIESILAYLGPRKVTGSIWIIGGDGRYYVNEAIYRVVSVIAAHKAKMIITAKDGLMTAPAMCMMIQKEKALGGILLTGSHIKPNPDGYLGIKYSTSSGRAASLAILNAIFQKSKKLHGYSTVFDLKFPMDDHLSYGFTINGNHMTVMVSDVTKTYGDFMETIFDFNTISKLFEKNGCMSGDFFILIDCMNSSGGPYALEIFEKRLGCRPGTILNIKPERSYQNEDTSLENCKKLVTLLKGGKYDAGFAMDNDGDRLMALGRKAVFVSHGDSVAVLAAHLHCIPYFQFRGIKGIARTLSTSTAVDRVAKNLNIPLYEVPVGLTNFCNLIEADLISFYGDEAFGLGSSHLTEKDAIWGILAWLSVLQHMKMPLHELLPHHWSKYGRTFTTRMDYDGVEENNSTALMNALEGTVLDPAFFGTTLGEWPFEYVLHRAEYFSYDDPTGKENANKTGVKILFDCESRIICRASHTKPNTFRLYLEHFSEDPKLFCNEPSVMTNSLFQVAIQLINMEKYIGRIKPSKIV